MRNHFIPVYTCSTPYLKMIGVWIVYEQYSICDPLSKRLVLIFKFRLHQLWNP